MNTHYRITRETEEEMICCSFVELAFAELSEVVWRVLQVESHSIETMPRRGHS